MTLAKPGTGEVITEARTGDLLPPSVQTAAAGRFRGARRRLAGGRRWSLQRREVGARAGRAGGGAAAGPGACARTSHSAARGRPLASWGRRPARAIRPTPTRRLLSGVCPTVKAPGCSALSGPTVPQGEDRAAAPHRVDALPLPQPPPPPERAAANDPRLRGGGPHGDRRSGRKETELTSARLRRGCSRAPGAAAAPGLREE
ncbi:unnamed protein product [Rangifer tarandus platyrhynchus]|uniref:Uncharacterized protein n=2 Tax=Rangifer tarandus platyrhynchus TaxID=3082113 RepID=A0ABN8XTW6_RANTA|nr:unnamed protein product [Rangifer tarandus platyrhynchus]CAI9691104.1 unnamed protein product [Rangifer tarandus platyrhynchus]